jgi:hypothetical protein
MLRRCGARSKSRLAAPIPEPGCEGGAGGAQGAQRLSYVRRWRRTAWLGISDSNCRIRPRATQLVLRDNFAGGRRKSGGGDRSRTSCVIRICSSGRDSAVDLNAAGRSSHRAGVQKKFGGQAGRAILAFFAYLVSLVAVQTIAPQTQSPQCNIHESGTTPQESGIRSR